MGGGFGVGGHCQACSATELGVELVEQRKNRDLEGTYRSGL